MFVSPINVSIRGIGDRVVRCDDQRDIVDIISLEMQEFVVDGRLVPGVRHEDFGDAIVEGALACAAQFTAGSVPALKVTMTPAASTWRSSSRFSAQAATRRVADKNSRVSASDCMMIRPMQGAARETWVSARCAARSNQLPQIFRRASTLVLRRVADAVSTLPPHKSKRRDAESCCNDHRDKCWT